MRGEIQTMYGCATTIIFFGVLIANLLHFVSASVISTGDYNKDFFVSWSPSHVNTSVDGRARNLKLDNDSGSGFESNDMFLFGQMDMKIKLVPGHSAGIVVAYYLTSDQPNHDEIDFEFLGNVEGQPIVLQTNVFADGFDDREERIKLWFDPTKDFHTYSILWNIYQIVGYHQGCIFTFGKNCPDEVTLMVECDKVKIISESFFDRFMVDWVPIRVYRNHADKGVGYPRWQPMSLKVSLWDGDNWATRGGKDKIDWSKGPFIASFGDYKIDGCIWRGNARFCRGEPTSNNWWNLPKYNTLSPSQRRLFKWVRKYFLTYDYCQDNLRFQNQLPKECSLPKY